MNTLSLTRSSLRNSLVCVALGAVAAFSAACGSLLNDLETAAGREAGKALAARNGSGGASSGSTASTPTPAPPASSSGGGVSGSNASMGTSGAVASGSCVMKNADGTMLMCTEFENIPAEASEMFQHNACVGGTAKWAESTKCPTEGRKGGCKSQADEKGAYAIVWQYMPNMARAARDSCVKDGKNTWLP